MNTQQQTHDKIIARINEIEKQMHQLKKDKAALEEMLTSPLTESQIDLLLQNELS